MAMALLGAAHAAWAGLAQVNFFYPVWHDTIGIDQTIEIYAPKNRYRHGFEQTTEAERSRLFAAIVDAIHNQGRGLRALVYLTSPGARSIICCGSRRSSIFRTSRTSSTG